jgi:hypothetical protein
MKTLVKFIVILCFAVALPLNSHAAAPVFNLQLTLANEDFGGSVNDSYKKVTASVRSLLGITRNSAFNLNADLYTRAYDDFDQWDSNGILLEAIYSFIPTAGFRKPTYIIGLRQEHESFDDSNRDFNRTSLFLAILLRLDDSISMTPGIQYSEKSTDQEDDNISSVFVNIDKHLTEKWLTYLNLKYESEKIATSASVFTSANRVDIAGHHTPAESGANSPNLPSSSSATDINTDSNNVILTIGANYSIDRHHSIDVSYQRQNYGISDNADVTGDVISIDYFYKF